MILLHLLNSVSAWAQSTESSGSQEINLGAWHAIISASPVVQLTLVVLVAMSVICWAIIFGKRKQFQQADQANQPFLDLFWKANSLDAIFSAVDEHPKSNIARVFKSGYLELRRMAESKMSDSGPKSPMLSGIDNLDRSLRKAVDRELGFLESRLGFLATTGSTGPFIGLFGTVWGIMGSFQKIGATGMASLAVVAPGISEALIATAIGLAAAIPATVAFNHYITLLKKEELELSGFSADFLNIAKRNFFRDN